MQEMSWNSYLKWVLECCNESFNGNMEKGAQGINCTI